MNNSDTNATDARTDMRARLDRTMGDMSQQTATVTLTGAELLSLTAVAVMMLSQRPEGDTGEPGDSLESGVTKLARATITLPR